MGNFVIVVKAVGGHGCQRDVGHGGQVAAGCGHQGCPDCIARLMVALLRRWGTNVESATLTHWPNADGTPKHDTVRDDLLTLVRTGTFSLASGGSNLPLLAPTPPTENAGPVMDWDAQANPAQHAE